MGEVVSPEMIDALLASGASPEWVLDQIKDAMLRERDAARKAMETDARAISWALRDAVIARDGFVCAYCGDDVAVPHLDHVHPFSRGGKTSLRNLVVSCKPCNSSKGGKLLTEWSGR